MAGFGFVAKATREAKTLQMIARAGVPCPEVLAHGADKGQAFLLLREQPEMIDVRHYVEQHPRERLGIARALGKELARMHAAGIEHGDLYAKHVLAGAGPRFCFLDWQRARMHRTTRTWCYRDLAALDATVPASLVTDRTRLVFLRSYWEALDIFNRRELARQNTTGLFRLAGDIRRHSVKLQQKRRIRKLRPVPLSPGAQSIVWLDGEALCVTGAYRAELGKNVPAWLRLRATPAPLETTSVPLADDRTGTLVRRSGQGFGWLLSWLRRAPSPEVEQAALLFRLEQLRVAAPRLLAFGEGLAGTWQRQSFLLTELSKTNVTLGEFLTTAAGRGRWRVLQQAGVLLNRLHQGGLLLDRQATHFGAICAVQSDDTLTLTTVGSLLKKDRPWQTLARMDLPLVGHAHPLSKTDALRFFLGYVGTQRLTSESRALARALGGRRPSEVAR